MMSRRPATTSQVSLPTTRSAGTGALQSAAIILVGLVAYAGLCAALWRSGARGGDAYVVVPRAIDGARAPKWLPHAEVARVNALGNVVRGRSMLDPDLASDLAACYLESPWVSRVLHVRRVYPNRLDVALAIRKPFAVVRRASGPAIVLDRSGVRLPASAAPDGLPVLRGAAGIPPVPGQSWEEVRVRDGLRVLARYSTLVEGQGDAFAPREVSVREWSRPDARPLVSVHTTGGFSIAWGVDLPSGEATITGPSARQKLTWLAGALRQLASDTGRISYISLRQRAGLVVKYRRDAAGDR
jgi:hypothetical protein